MPEGAVSNVSLPNPVEVTETVSKIATQGRRLIIEYLKRQCTDRGTGMADMTSVGSASVYRSIPRDTARYPFNSWSRAVNNSSCRSDPKARAFNRPSEMACAPLYDGLAQLSKFAPI